MALLHNNKGVKMRIFSLYFIIITSVVSFLLSCKSIDDVAVGIIEKGGEIPIVMRNSSFKVIGILKGKGNFGHDKDMINVFKKYYRGDYILIDSSEVEKYRDTTYRYILSNYEEMLVSYSANGYSQYRGFRFFILDRKTGKRYLRTSVGGFESYLSSYLVAINKLSQGYTIESKVNPKKADSYQKRGLARLKMGDYEGAVSDFTSAIMLDSNNIESYVKRAESYFGDENYQKAIDDYSIVLKLNSQNSTYYSERSYCKILLGNYTDALDDIKRALEINPHSAEALYYRGLVNLKTNKQEEACRDFKSANEYDFEWGGEMLLKYCK